MKKWTDHHTHPAKDGTRCRVILHDGTELEDVYFVTNYCTAFNWLTYEKNDQGDRIAAKEIPGIGHPTYNFVAYWQEMEPELKPSEICDEEDAKFSNQFLEPQRQFALYQRGVTHPAIDLDYYEWRKKMSTEDKAFLDLYSMSADARHALLMFAWQNSRVELRKKAEKKDS